jgi:nicotinate-nucleotide adenylyltransferase
MTANLTAPIGIFGGTFDPIHYGHLRTAFEVLQALDLRELRFIPAGDPPHRDKPRLDAARRLELVRAAVAGQPGFVVDDREIRRRGPSYTVVTLEELRAELPDTPLCLVLGMDAFRGLATWHRWHELLVLAHLVVAPRPGWDAPMTGVVSELLADRRVEDPAALQTIRAGKVFVQHVTQLDISSTEMRELLAAGRDPRYLVPDAVRALLERAPQAASSTTPTR